MIARIRGILREQRDTEILLDVNGICYVIFVPRSIMKNILERVSPDGEIELVTFHYQQLDMGRGIPILIGFLNEIERDFFERFISVSGIGPKAAIRALTLPIPVIAQAIDEADLALLKSLPGVGEQRGREIIAKLQGKVGKFGLIQAKEILPREVSSVLTVLENEAIAILTQLEYKKSEAKQMIHAALERNPKVTTSEELLNEVYRQQRLAADPV